MRSICNARLHLWRGTTSSPRLRAAGKPTFLIWVNMEIGIWIVRHCMASRTQTRYAEAGNDAEEICNGHFWRIWVRQTGTPALCLYNGFGAERPSMEAVSDCIMPDRRKYLSVMAITMCPLGLVGVLLCHFARYGGDVHFALSRNG